MTAANPVLRQFEQRFGAIRRARRMETLLLFTILVLLFLVSAVWTDFSPPKILEGAPKIGSSLNTKRMSGFCWMIDNTAGAALTQCGQR